MKRRLKAILLAAIAAVTILFCSSCSGKNEIETKEKVVRTVTMNTYEHTLSVPVTEDNTTRNIQYEYHPGYEAVGITSTAYGKYFDSFGGGAIVYTNNEPVICKTTGSEYLSFGTPETKEEKQYGKVTNGYKEFDIGEHIISVPLDKDNTANIVQYKYHEGYKIVGASSSAIGQYFDSFCDGAVLYVNVVPVKCRSTEKGYTEFGTPIKEEALKLSKEN